MSRSNKRNFRLNFNKTYTHEELVTAAIGRTCSRDAVDENTKRRLTLAETTELLAERIVIGSKGAVNPYRGERGLSFLDTLDGRETVERSFSNQNWLPQVASYNRRSLLRNLSIFLELSSQQRAYEIVNRDGEICVIPGTYPEKALQYRYMVLTGGPRIPLAALNCRIIYIM